MTRIEQRVETNRVVNPDYARKVYSDADIAAAKHRGAVGGRWDTHGEHQLNFVKSQGLKPDGTLLDVGCGPLRAGRHLVDYLDAGNYYGIDANLSLIQAGYDVELTDEQRDRLPVGNLRANDRFDGDFGVFFDMALAQSVFTHVSLNHIRLCLYRTARVMRPGGKFYATFYERPRSTPVDKIFIRGKGGRPNLGEQNVYWYYRTISVGRRPASAPGDSGTSATGATRPGRRWSSTPGWRIRATGRERRGSRPAPSRPVDSWLAGCGPWRAESTRHSRSIGTGWCRSRPASTP